MARRNNRGSNRRIQNVRVVDSDEGTDSLKVSSILTNMSMSNSQTRVICGYTGLLTPAAAGGGTVSQPEMTGTDDWTSFSGQFTEFRIRAIQFRIFDVQPNSSSVSNTWATFHKVGGTTSTTVNDVVDRPDARVIPPGNGWVELAWVAHGQPEMEFQSVTSASDFGGLVYAVNPSGTLAGIKYQIVAKFIVDFRGRT